jgi:hypothetical protein
MRNLHWFEFMVHKVSFRFTRFAVSPPFVILNIQAILGYLVALIVTHLRGPKRDQAGFFSFSLGTQTVDVDGSGSGVPTPKRFLLSTNRERVPESPLSDRLSYAYPGIPMLGK